MHTAYYSASINDFVGQSPQRVLGELAKSNPFALEFLQCDAWEGQIELLQSQLAGSREGWIAFEFAIPRMGKRVDAILIVAGIVFVVEFKVGSHEFEASAIDQVVDYALDLKNFHAGSHERRLVPVVVATRAEAEPLSLVWGEDGVAVPVRTNGSDIGDLLRAVVAKTPFQPMLDGESWSRSGYRPTPTIIEAAQALYQGHRVERHHTAQMPARRT